MKIIVNEKVLSNYPSAIFGSLLVKNVVNKKQDSKLNERKKILQEDVKTRYEDTSVDEILQSYKEHFKRWNKSYPIEYQIQSVLKGKNLPNVSVLVDSMFHAELKNRILTSGHNLDELIGNLVFGLSVGTEQYLKIDGNTQQLKAGDILLHDDKDILANILYGPAKRSTITLQTNNVLYLAWSPGNIDTQRVRSHLEDLLSNLQIVYGPVDAKITII